MSQPVGTTFIDWLIWMFDEEFYAGKHPIRSRAFEVYTIQLEGKGSFRVTEHIQPRLRYRDYRTVTVHLLSPQEDIFWNALWNQYRVWMHENHHDEWTQYTWNFQIKQPWYGRLVARLYR